MKLTVSLARKLLGLSRGETLPRSQLKNPLVERMIEEGVLALRSRGTRQSVCCPAAEALHHYLRNHLGVSDLSLFIETASKSDLMRSEAVHVASDSKLKTIRSFKGFLVNCLQPLETHLNGAPFRLAPVPGAFTYIYDFEQFVPAADITVVGVENGENFRYLERQQGLFPFEKPLFVSRYPQSGDLLRWLQSIANPYVHFGDFDFAGIRIYLNEFKKVLGDRAEFFVPEKIEALFEKYGNRGLYDRQLSIAPEPTALMEPGLKRVRDLICREKKGVEQEVLLQGEKLP